MFAAVGNITTGVLGGALMGLNGFKEALKSGANFLTGKSTRSILGVPFTQSVAQEYRNMIDEQEIEEHGIPYEETDIIRPAPGAFELFDEDNIKYCLNVLKLNGLHRFEDQLPVDPSFIPVEMPKKENPDDVVVQKMPIESELLYHRAMQKNKPSKVTMRIVVMDPQFVNDQGKPLYKNVPLDYVKAVVNNTNPVALFSVNHKHFNERLKHFGSFSEAVKQRIEFIVKKWQGKQVPYDNSVLVAILMAVFLHEGVHGLALSQPDKISDELPQNVQELLQKITIDKYFELINSEPELQTSISFIKNAFKSMNDEEIGALYENEATREKGINHTVGLFSLEMFCDRFSMYLYENAKKLELYQEAFAAAKLPFQVNIDTLVDLEESRREGRLHETPGLKDAFSETQIAELIKALEAAEIDHVLISQFGDPKITEKERAFFEDTLNLLKHYDEEKSIMQFTRGHLGNSRWARVTLAGGLKKKMSMGVQKDAQGSFTGMPFAGQLAVNLLTRLTQDDVTSTMVDDQKNPEKTSRNPEKTVATLPENPNFAPLDLSSALQEDEINDEEMVAAPEVNLATEARYGVSASERDASGNTAGELLKKTTAEEAPVFAALNLTMDTEYDDNADQKIKSRNARSTQG